MRWTLQIVWNHFSVQYWQLCSMQYSERWFLLASCASISRQSGSLSALFESWNDPTVVTSSPASQFMPLRAWTHWEDGDSDRWTAAVLMTRQRTGFEVDRLRVKNHNLKMPRQTWIHWEDGSSNRYDGGCSDEEALWRWYRWTWGWPVECWEPRLEASRTSS